MVAVAVNGGYHADSLTGARSLCGKISSERAAEARMCGGDKGAVFQFGAAAVWFRSDTVLGRGGRGARGD